MLFNSLPSLFFDLFLNHMILAYNNLGADFVVLLQFVIVYSFNARGLRGVNGILMGSVGPYNLVNELLVNCLSLGIFIGL